MAQFPSEGDRAALLRLPHPRPRLRQPRHRADAARPALRLRRGPRLRRRDDRDHDRRVATRPPPSWPRHLGPFPGYADERATHAAGHPQPPPRRLQRPGRRVRGALGPADGDSMPTWPRPTLLERGPRGVGPRAGGWASSTATATPRPPCWRPTGTIGLLMDCDTTGVEPDFALVKFKKLAGGGYFKIANQSIEPALKNLGYAAEERTGDPDYVLGTLTLDGAPHDQPRVAAAQGLHRRRPRQGREGPAGRLRAAASPSTPGRSAKRRCSGSASRWPRRAKPGFDLLRALGFSAAGDRRGQRASSAAR